MKTLKYIILTFSIIHFQFSIVTAQNLVPNPSFEDTVACPNTFMQIYNSVAWRSFRYSPDYFNKCSTSNFVSVPSNSMGYQFPSNINCNAYIGLYMWGGQNYREFAGCKLVSSMIIGQKYYISIKVCLAESSTCATNNLGITFSTIPYSQNVPMSINNSPHFFTPDIITDTLNWTTISGSFIADSAYQYIAIGNFFTDSLTDTISFSPGNTSYYYIDDICVSTDSTTCNPYTAICNTNITNININKQINIYPNPASDFLNIDYNNDIKNINIKIFDIYGRLIKNYNKKINIINISLLADGIYLLKFQTNDNTIIEKFIKD